MTLSLSRFFSLSKFQIFQFLLFADIKEEVISIPLLCERIKISQIRREVRCQVRPILST